MKKRVYVPELDKIFKSTQEAARALGVDAGNISKVIKGKRRSAGGYHFIGAEAAPGQKRPTREALRKAGKVFLPPDPLEGLREKLSNLIKSANKQTRKLKKEGLLGFSGAAADIQSLGSVLGKTKGGYISASDKKLKSFSEAELNKYIRMIEQRKKRKSYTKLGAYSEVQRLADTFGTTPSRLKEFADILPLVFAALDNTKKTANSDAIREAVEDVMADPEGTPEDLTRVLASMSDTYDMTEALNDLLHTEAHLLDQYAPLRPDLEELLQWSKMKALDLDEDVENIAGVLLANAGSPYYNEQAEEMIRENIQEILRSKGIEY